MRQEFIFDPTAGNDELMITIPEEIAREIIKEMDLQLTVSRNPDRFPDQPERLALTMLWIGQFISFSQR